jgi:hypothetical protein
MEAMLARLAEDPALAESEPCLRTQVALIPEVVQAA